MNPNKLQQNTNRKYTPNPGLKIWKLCPNTKEKLELYSNSVEAGGNVGTNPRNIREAAREKNKSRGFYWEFDTIIDFENEKWEIISRNGVDINISTHGRIKDKNQRLRIGGTKHGYITKHCNGKTYLVHILVAETFISNPNKLPIVNHKDLNKTNNNITNLEWVTHSENSKHYFKNV